MSTAKKEQKLPKNAVDLLSMVDTSTTFAPVVRDGKLRTNEGINYNPTIKINPEAIKANGDLILYKDNPPQVNKTIYPLLKDRVAHPKDVYNFHNFPPENPANFPPAPRSTEVDSADEPTKKKRRLLEMLKGKKSGGYDLSKALLGTLGGVGAVLGKNPEYATKASGVYSQINNAIKERDMNDPNSRDSQLARAVAFKLYPKLGQMQTFKMATANELAKYGLLKPGLDSLEERAYLGGRGASQNRLEATLNAEQQQKYIKETTPQRNILDSIGQIEDLGKEYINPDFSLDDYEGENVPGYTIGKFRFGFGKAADDFIAAEKGLQSAIQKELAGLTLTPTEQANVEATLAITKSNDEQARMRAYKRLRDIIRQKLKDTEVAFSNNLPGGNPVETYKSKGGRTSEYFEPKPKTTSTPSVAPQPSKKPLPPKPNAVIKTFPGDGKRYWFDPVTKQNLGAVNE